MTLFALAFFTIYGGMNAYVFLKARAALGMGLRAGLPVALFMAFMVAAPVIIRYLERHGMDLPARGLAHVGYAWFGLIFLFVSASVFVEAYRLGLYGAGAALGKDIRRLLPGAGFSFYVPLALSVVIFIYGYFEARDIRTEHVTVRTDKLPPGVDRLRVVQISDVHLGLIVREERLGLILEKVRQASPDVLVSTGDLVDGQLDDISGIAALIRGIDAKYGKYAVTGNHEYYAGLGQALAATEAAGFRVLRGEAVAPGGLITIAGVDYASRRISGNKGDTAEERLLSGLPGERFTLLLKHVPLVNGASRGRFDLQLSGHTHRGQIFPFGLVAMLRYPWTAGFYKLEDGSALHVSRGSGTWGPPVRFLAPPEVTVVDIVREAGEPAGRKKKR